MKRILAAVLLAFGVTSTAHAELLGLLTGRSADPSSLSKMSVDAGASVESDLRTLAVRGNYRVNDQITAFAHVGQTKLDFFDLDGISFGGGAYFFLPDQRIVSSLDVALKGSLAIASLEGNFGFEADYQSLSAEAVVSGKEPLADNGLAWYATGGLVFFRSDVEQGGRDVDDNDTEPTLSGGITLPLGPGTLFTGLELVDEIFLGVGYRYNL